MGKQIKSRKRFRKNAANKRKNAKMVASNAAVIKSLQESNAKDLLDRADKHLQPTV